MKFTIQKAENGWFVYIETCSGRMAPESDTFVFNSQDEMLDWIRGKIKSCKSLGLLL